MRNPNSLKDRVVLITGGTRGIGRAIAERLLADGAAVAICGRSQKDVEATVREMQSQPGGKVKGKAADVTKHEQVEPLFRFIDEQFGGLDVLVNNAGIGVFRPLRDLTVEEWKATLETNLSGAFYCSREALYRFGNRKGGHIVNISSLAGKHAFAGGSAYNASKFGLNGLTEAMMQELRSEDVRVSYVMPGSVATDFSAPRSAVSAPQRSVSGGDVGQIGVEKSALDWRIWPEDVADIVHMVLSMPARTLVSSVEVRPSKPKK
ncbi:MAG: SDR family oxidoreductase [Bryobacterales bacterium]|nr:SDR family oxidoreductase [Bryobacterales bacterium]MBV9397549.1 SDR family oxidoreductase [Bryobacterales bacterium]